jgi:hypothetical protein
MTATRLARARARATLFIGTVVPLVRGSTLLGQQAPTPVASYRPPVIVLAAPSAGASVPADKPVIVVRFAAGEPDDAIDPSSLRVSVDGEDRTLLLQLGSAEAWGPLARDTTTSQSLRVASPGVPLIAPGVHLVHVRLCSMRGVCAAFDTPVTVAPPDATLAAARAPSPPDSATKQHARLSMLHRVIDLVIVGARKLLVP